MRNDRESWGGGGAKEYERNGDELEGYLYLHGETGKPIRSSKIQTQVEELGWGFGQIRLLQLRVLTRSGGAIPASWGSPPPLSSWFFPDFFYQSFSLSLQKKCEIYSPPNYLFSFLLGASIPNSFGPLDFIIFGGLKTFLKVIGNTKKVFGN